MTLGNKLAKLRKESELTQEQLAEILGVSRQAISKWESNTTYLETDKLIRMSELYHCSLDYLLKDSEEEFDTTYSDKDAKESVLQATRKEHHYMYYMFVIVIMLILFYVGGDIVHAIF